MKNLLLAAIAALTFGATAAQAEVPNPAWVCRLEFNGEAKGFQVILGKYGVRAKGDIQCLSLKGETKVIPVQIAMGGSPIAPRIGVGKIRMHAESAQVNLFSNSPEDLLGDYYVGQASASLGLGAGAFTGVHVDIPNLSVNFSVQFNKGLGFNAGISRMRIAADHSRM